MKLRRMLQNTSIHIAINYFWAIAGVLLFPKFISDESLHFSNSMFSLLLFLVIIILLNNESKREKCLRRDIYTHCLGFLFSVMTSFGYSLDAYATIDISGLLLCISVYTHIIAKLLSFLWRYLIITEEKLNKSFGRISLRLDHMLFWLTRHPVVVFILLLFMWIPAFIADFPGGFRYDATRELNQITDGFSGSFPLLHSAIITTLLPFIYNLTGSYNYGIMIYIIIQMGLISLFYTHIIITFIKQRINAVLVLIIVAYCGLFPVVQILVVQEVRDVLFSALLMYTVFLLYLLKMDTETFFRNVKYPLLLSVVIILTILARNNNMGVIAHIGVFILSLVFWLVYRKKQLIGASAFSISCLALYFICSTLLGLICQPFEAGSQKEALSLVSQSLARAYLNDEWNQEEKEELSKWMDVEDIGNVYIPENADPTKLRLLASPDNKTDFIKFIVKTGIKHFDSFFEATLANTQNMWFPPSVIDGYNQRYKKEKGPYQEWKKCYFYITNSVEEPAIHMNYLPFVLDYYTQIGLNVSFEKIPIISMFFSIGFHFWVLLNCIFYNLFRRNRQLLLPLFVILVYMLISAFVPLVLMRYFAAIFLCVPLLIVFTFQPIEKKLLKKGVI